MCDIGTSFLQNQDILVPMIDDNNIAIYKAGSNLQMNLTYYQPVQNTVEWTVEFWFMYALDEMNTFNFPYNLLIAGHSMAYSSSACYGDSRFQFTLIPDTPVIYDGIRFPQVYVTDGTLQYSLLYNGGQGLQDSQWYHFALVSDQVNAQMTMYTDFQPTSDGPKWYRQLSQCQFFIGDNTGSPVNYFQDTAISVRELRSWNEARTLGQLMFYANRAVNKDTQNLAAYYKLSELNYALFESVQMNWQYPFVASRQIDVYDYIMYTSDTNHFDVSCPPGMTGGVNGCTPDTEWIQNQEPVAGNYFPVAIEYDIGNKIYNRLFNRDLQLSIGIQSKSLHASGTYTLFTIENLLQFNRTGNQYQLTVFYQYPFQTTLTSTLTYGANSYLYFFIIIDQPGQQLFLIDQAAIQTYTLASNGQQIPMNQYFTHTSNVQQFIIVGDDTQTDANYDAINHITVFNRVLSRNEMYRIATLGIRTMSENDPSILAMLRLPSNVSYFQQPQGNSFYEPAMQDWPAWVQDPDMNVFQINSFDQRKITLCPEGYSLQSNYQTNPYVYCQQRSAFSMRGQVAQSFSIESIKSNIRYAMTLRLRFRFLNLDTSLAGSYVDLFRWNKVFKMSILDLSTIKITLYNTTGFQNATVSKTLSTSLGSNWHEISATLFNFTWTVNLDGNQIIFINDTMFYYNITADPGTQFTVDLSTSGPATVLQLADIGIFGLPLSSMELRYWSTSSFLNQKQYEGSLLAYYDLSSQTFNPVANDLSLYAKQTSIVQKATGALNDLIYWSYETDNQNYHPSSLIDLEVYSYGFQQVYQRNKNLLFTRKAPIVLTESLSFNSEYTIELCYYVYGISIFGDTILEIDAMAYQVYGKMVTLSLNFFTQNIDFVPLQTNTTNYFNLPLGGYNQWNCITAALSYNQSAIYIANFYQMGVSTTPDQFFSNYQTGGPIQTNPLNTTSNSTIRIGYNLYGSVREVRIWGTYINPALARRYYRSIQLIYHKQMIQAYWPMNDGIGNTLKDNAFGNDTIFDNTLNYWAKFTSPYDDLEICEGEQVFSAGGYCLTSEKFLELKSGYGPLNFTILSNAGTSQGYTYDLMSHSTISMWLCIRRLSPPTQLPTQNLFQLHVAKRYIATIGANQMLQLNTDAINPKTVIQGIDFSNFYDGWGFLSVSCSKLTTYCEVHHGLFNSNYNTFQSTIDRNGVLEYRYYHNDMLSWSYIPSTTISITGPVEGQRYQLFLKEIQVYQVQLPVQTILLKTEISLQSRLFNALIVHLKLDEYSGTQLYNNAYDTQDSFVYIENTAIKWHHYLETVPPGTTVYTNPIMSMFCNKENYTSIAQHCEYYNCHPDCSLPGRIGQCNGWTNTECLFINTTGTNIVYSSQYNDYLSCYKDCLTCESPFENQGCTSCISGAILYFDKQGLYAVANGSCWESCPPSTYLNLYGTQPQCTDCSNYCLCTGNPNQTCPSCMNSTFLYDSVRKECFISCPIQTFYNQYLQTCQSCSLSCETCTGAQSYQCLSCIPGLFLFKTTQGLTCKDNSCTSGFYYDPLKLGCTMCSPECQNCIAYSQDACTGSSCAYSYIQQLNPNNQTVFSCVSCSDIAANDERFEPYYDDKLGYCDEVCGDGFNMGYVQCDDGNLINFDGCSSQCTVELGHKCSGGSPTTKDVCTRIVPVQGNVNVQIGVATSSSYGVLELSFDTEVKVAQQYQNNVTSLIHAFLNGTCESTDLKYSVQVPANKFGWQTVQITYQINFNVPPNSNCYINVQFTQPGLFIARDGSIVQQNAFKPVQMPAHNVPSSTLQLLGSTAGSIQNIMLGFLIANLLAGFILGDGMQHMWFLINQLQIVYFMPLININIHQNARFVINLLQFVLADFFDKIPQYWGYIINLNDIQDNPYNSRYLAIGIESVHITTCYYQKLAVLTLFVALYPICWAGTFIKLSMIKNAFQKLFKMMQYGVLLQTFFEMYLELCVNLWVVVYAGLNYNNYSQIVSATVAMGLFVLATISPIFSYQKIMDSFDKLASKEFREQFNPLIEGTLVRPNSTVNQMWIPIFLFRRYVYAGILCIFQPVPLLQLILCVLQSVMMLSYLIVVKPFETWDFIFASIFYEFSILLFFLISSLFMFNYTDSEGVKISWALTAILAVDVIVALVFLSWDMKNKIKKGYQIAKAILSRPGGLKSMFKSPIHPQSEIPRLSTSDIHPLHSDQNSHHADRYSSSNNEQKLGESGSEYQNTSESVKSPHRIRASQSGINFIENHGDTQIAKRDIMSGKSRKSQRKPNALRNLKQEYDTSLTAAALAQLKLSQALAPSDPEQFNNFINHRKQKEGVENDHQDMRDFVQQQKNLEEEAKVDPSQQKFVKNFVQQRKRRGKFKLDVQAQEDGVPQ